MPGEITRAYEAPDGEKPLLPPWESNERNLDWLLRNDVHHASAFELGHFAGYFGGAPETTATGTMYDAWIKGWRTGREDREGDPATQPRE